MLIKVLKKIGKVILYFFTFVVLLIIISIAYPYFQSKFPDAYYVKNTTFLYDKFELSKRYNDDTGENVMDNFKDRPYYGVSLHRLKQSESGAVLIVRYYRPNPFLVIDADGFTKITIRLPILKNEIIDLASRKDVRVLITKGASAWPDSSCFAFLEEGMLKVELKDEKVWMKLDGRVECKKNSYDHIDIDETHWLKELNFSELNPWLGSVGDHPYAETMKRE